MIASLRSILAASSLALATPALADSPLIPNGTEPPAEHLGHVFMTFCAPQLAPMMERDFELFQNLFSFTPRDGDTDRTIGSVEDNIRVTLDTGWQGAVCEMTITPALAGDGFAIYEDLMAHLEQVENLPAPEAIDGGLSWSWNRPGDTRNITFTIDFIETAEGHTLRTTASQF